MTIEVGQQIPDGKFGYVPYSSDLDDPSACGKAGQLLTGDWKNKKVVLFGVPGAFTPTCHANHLPPYLKKYDEFKAKGVDAIYCIASNDLYVMSGWGRLNNTKDKIVMISDVSAEWLKAVGLTVDMSSRGWGIRSKRFAMIIDDLKVTYLGVEAQSDVGVSGADDVLAKL